jgi:cytochrome c-type biogenesis protein CcmH/NrfG
VKLAVLYTLLGDWKTAHECYTRSEELAPYRYERYLKWAEAMFRLRQYAAPKSR